MDGNHLDLHNSNLLIHGATRPAMESPLATASIYGEQVRGTAVVDQLHCESIAERSRLHHWEIHAHRHESLFQLFWIARGGCEASIDGRTCQIDGPALMLLPPQVMHGFRFDPMVEGLVITVQAQQLRRLLESHRDLALRLARAGAHALAGDEGRDLLAHAAMSLQREFSCADRNWRALALDSALLCLLIACGRSLPAGEANNARPGRRAESHLRRYQEWIEQHFRSQPPISACAAHLGISSTQLNRICRKELGCSALALLQARLLLEAQRELAYTTMSIKQIAHGLGFLDQAYFTRFYQRQAGVAPSDWRQQHRTDIGSSPR
jgi:AraC family transcriptional activator of pobA